MKVALQKQKVRDLALARLASLSQESVRRASFSLCNNLFLRPVVQQAENIALYYPFRNEISPIELMAMFHRAVFPIKKWIFPKISQPSDLKFFNIKNCDTELALGCFGIKEPCQSVVTKQRQVAINDIDVFIVPLLAFDKRKIRLGSGGGFYDRGLRFKNKKACLIGAAYSMQEYDSLPNAEFDIPMDFIVTENGVVE